jgi:hypothetical protein
MIKIEQLKNGAKATIVRNGVAQPVYLGMTVTRAELDTLETTGTVVYSIDESEIVEFGANTERAAVSSEPPKSPEPSTAPLEAAVTAPAPVKPVIVKPAPRSPKK